MKSCSLLFMIVLITAFGCFLPETAMGAGEVCLAVGGVWPQGSFAAYGDPGIHVLARGELQIPSFPAGAGWADAAFTQFSSESFETYARAGDVIIPLKQTTSQRGFSMHVGFQLGSSSRHSFFRPRASIGVGFHYFTTLLELKRKDAESDESPLYSEDLDSQLRFGWRGILGADFYFKSAWGVSVDILFDQVLDLNRVDGEEESERTSSYQGFAVGVVAPFD